MAYVKTIICFANSRKMSGRCIAGKEFKDGNPGKWVRPISDRPTHELSEEEREYEDRREPHLLDVISIPFVRKLPESHQQENHVIDSSHAWVYKGHIEWNQIDKWLDSPRLLWNMGESSYSGINNRVSIGLEDGKSLFLIEIEQLRLFVGRKAPEFSDSKRGVRGQFIYRKVSYRMDITDPVIEQTYLALEDGQYTIENPVLVVSLGDPYDGYFYKLIAAVMFLKRCI